MKKQFSILLFLIISLALFSCNGLDDLLESGDKSLDDFPYPEASADTDSWLQWKEYDDSEITIDWYVDDTTFSCKTGTMVANKIKEITGINIRFQTPAVADGSKLSTMISGNSLPDVISIAANQTDRILLAEDEGYVFSITDLAEKWAPTLNARMNEELYNMYKASDGKLYGIPQYFYEYEQLLKMRELDSGHMSNGVIIARKDYLDAYHAYMYDKDPNWDPATVCTPQGILEMCLWVKNTYALSNSNPTVLLAPFENQRTHGSLAIRWLMEYFSALYEDKDGNYQYAWATDEFEEMMLWLNDLYTNHLLQTSDFTNTSSQVATSLQTGKPFIFIGSPQNYTSNLKNWILNNPKGEDAEYVPIIFGNSEGVVPQLSVTGNSYFFNMISQNCKRPDRVIKLFDFLYSEEGQKLLYYGIEGDGPDDEDATWYYTVEPGGTEEYKGKVYDCPYGLIEYTDKVRDDLNNGNGAQYGLRTPNVALNGWFEMIASDQHNYLYSMHNYVLYNSKAALIPYTYIYRGFEFELDPTKEGYRDVAQIETNLRLLWLEYYQQIICAKNKTLAKNILEETLETCERKGLAKYIAFKNESFQTHKARYGFTFASPINDPNNTAYKALKFTTVYGDVSYNKEIPSYIVRK